MNDKWLSVGEEEDRGMAKETRSLIRHGSRKFSSCLWLAALLSRPCRRGKLLRKYFSEWGKPSLIGRTVWWFCQTTTVTEKAIGLSVLVIDSHVASGAGNGNNRWSSPLSQSASAVPESRWSFHSACDWRPLCVCLLLFESPDTHSLQV